MKVFGINSNLEVMQKEFPGNEPLPKTVTVNTSEGLVNYFTLEMFAVMLAHPNENRGASFVIYIENCPNRLDVTKYINENIPYFFAEGKTFLNAENPKHTSSLELLE